MRNEIKFSVPFVRGKQRPRFVHGHTYTPKETKQAEYEIAVAYKGASIRRFGKVVKAPKGVPVHVRAEMYKAQQKRRPKLPEWLGSRIPFVQKPDADNVLKCGLDGLNGVAWDDDAQVVTLFAQKKDRNGVTHDRTEFTVVWEGEENGQEI